MSMGRFSEEWAIVGTIDPRDANNTDESSDVVDASLYHELVAVVQLGVINASATYDGKWRDSATSGGTYADVTGKAITQLTGAGSDGAKQVICSLLPEQMNTGARYAKFVVDNSAHSQLAAVLILGRPKYKPGTDADLSSVDEVIN